MRKIFYLAIMIFILSTTAMAQQPAQQPDINLDKAVGTTAPLSQQRSVKLGQPATDAEAAAINQAVAEYERAVALAAAQREAAILRVYSEAERSPKKWTLQPGQDGKLYWVAVEQPKEEKGK